MDLGVPQDLFEEVAEEDASDLELAGKPDIEFLAPFTKEKDHGEDVSKTVLQD